MEFSGAGQSKNATWGGGNRLIFVRDVRDLWTSRKWESGHTIKRRGGICDMEKKGYSKAKDGKTVNESWF